MDTDQSPTFDLAKIRSDASDASRNRLSDRGSTNSLQVMQKHSAKLRPKGQGSAASSGPSFGDDLDEGCSPNYIDEESGKPIGDKTTANRGSSTFALHFKRIQALTGDKLAANASSEVKKLPQSIGSQRVLEIR